MTTSNDVILNRVFTRNTIKDLINGRIDKVYLAAVKRYVNDVKNKNNQQIISEVYHVLEKSYRNEYFYKNTLLNKLLLGVHSPRTTTALTEVPVNKSKADFILINGKAVVYEIKTELDNFDRLETQIMDYYRAFNNVAVVTCESSYQNLIKRLDSNLIGIYVLTDRNTLSPRRIPVEDNSKLDHKTMFKILRKAEYESIIFNIYGKLPNESQFRYYSSCKDLFCDIDINIVYNLYLKELKKRKIDFENLYSSVPYELKYLLYFQELSKAEYHTLQEFLQCSYGG